MWGTANQQAILASGAVVLANRLAHSSGDDGVRQNAHALLAVMSQAPLPPPDHSHMAGSAALTTLRTLA
jgi:hypothetical protein